MAKVYDLQNRAIHEARRQLEEKGIVEKGKSLDCCRWIAGKLNLGIQSISRLSLTQRRTLIEKLKEMGADVRNPQLYESDLRAENADLVGFPKPSEEQFRMLDTLAACVTWRSADGYKRLCYKLLGAERPRNDREVTRLRITLENMIESQNRKPEEEREQTTPHMRG